jgi:hypothetical protein
VLQVPDFMRLQLLKMSKLFRFDVLKTVFPDARSVVVSYSLVYCPAPYAVANCR